MDFGLTDEQKLLEQTLRRLLAEAAPPSRVREIMNGETAHDAKLWAQLAELGIAGILVPESQGGGGLQMLDAALAMQSLGHGATPAPFLNSGRDRAGGAHGGTPAQRGVAAADRRFDGALLGVVAERARRSAPTPACASRTVACTARRSSRSMPGPARFSSPPTRPHRVVRATPRSRVTLLKTIDRHAARRRLPSRTAPRVDRRTR
jgi:hypothetical protein